MFFDLDSHRYVVGVLPTPVSDCPGPAHLHLVMEKDPGPLDPGKGRAGSWGCSNKAQEQGSLHHRKLKSSLLRRSGEGSSHPPSSGGPGCPWGAMAQAVLSAISASSSSCFLTLCSSLLLLPGPRLGFGVPLHQGDHTHLPSPAQILFLGKSHPQVLKPGPEGSFRGAQCSP